MAQITGGSFDVALTVERAGSLPPDFPPSLAFTGAPLLVLIALLALLLAAGLTALLSAKQREAEGRGGNR